MEKYLLCKPQGGFCDNLNFINICIQYCKKFNRILLINTKSSFTYKINFSDYFFFNNNQGINIITDINQIEKIVSGKKKSVYPNYLKNDLPYYSSRSKKCGYYWEHDKLERLLNIDLKIDYLEDVIVYENCAGKGKDLTKDLFKTLDFKENILEDFYFKYNLIKKPYLCIQIRNSDRKCNFQDLYNRSQLIVFLLPILLSFL